MNSFAHYSFGAVCEWMFFRLAGIDTDGPGYRRIIIRPSPPSPGSNAAREPIHWVNAHYDSIHGRIVSNWRRTADRFELETTIPANTTATVYVPAKSAAGLTESGKPINEVAGVKVLRQEAETVVLAVESGSYRFQSKTLNESHRARQSAVREQRVPDLKSQWIALHYGARNRTFDPAAANLTGTA